MNLFRRLRRAGAESNPELDSLCRELHEEGFTRVRGGFPRGVIEDVLASVKNTLRRNQQILGRHIDGDGHYPRIINLHMLDASLLRLFTENELALAVQDEFFHAESALYTSLYYERGSAQSIHRDTPYFTTRPEYRYLGVWVALEDADESNGCLEVVRKGHLVPELDRAAIALQYYKSLDEVPPGAPAGDDFLWDAYQSKMMEACRERGLGTERVEAQAGDVVIWHPQLPHGGSHILDLSRTRHSFVMHVTPRGARVYQQDVFFNPAKRVPERAKWAYGAFAGRNYVVHDNIDIGHKERRSLTDFAR
jgi:phytanoyl-CoA hydroxylase